MGIGSIASSGIKAALTHMESISNNIANVNTLGFKKTFLNFADIYSGMAGGRAIGLGTRVHSVHQNFSPGRVESSEGPLDMCLSNDGFFVQKDPTSGRVSYTRAGRMSVDKDGYITGFNGVLQGYPAIDGVVSDTGNLVDLRLPTSPVPAKATDNLGFQINLNAGEEAITDPFDQDNKDTYNYSSTETIYDSLGQHYTVTAYYVKTAANTWDVHVAVDDTMVGSGSLNFDSEGALVSSPGLTGLSFTPTSGAVSPQNFDIDVSAFTQYHGENKVYDHFRNGMSSGVFNGLYIDGDGKVQVSYSNGLTRVEGQIAVAKFRSPQGLLQSDNMSWLESTESGPASVSLDNSQNAIKSQLLEYSNVDLSEELIKLIGAQHDFQANAQVQQTYNQILQTIENL